LLPLSYICFDFNSNWSVFHIVSSFCNFVSFGHKHYNLMCYLSVFLSEQHTLDENNTLHKITSKIGKNILFCPQILQIHKIVLQEKVFVLFQIYKVLTFRIILKWEKIFHIFLLFYRKCNLALCVVVFLLENDNKW
jgi:hypothetical protein